MNRPVWSRCVYIGRLVSALVSCSVGTAAAPSENANNDEPQSPITAEPSAAAETVPVGTTTPSRGEHPASADVAAAAAGPGTAQAGAQQTADTTTPDATTPDATTPDTLLVDETLRGAAEDLDLTVHQMLPTHVFRQGDYLIWENSLQLPPAGTITLAALLLEHPAGWQLRLVARNEDGFVTNITTPIDKDNVEVTTVRSLAQLVKRLETKVPNLPEKTAGALISAKDSSEGKATLAATGALFGGYLGFAIENVGGSADSALVYPLVALGSGVGMATALVAAEEWPVSRPRAWYIAGGGFWLTSSAVFIANEQALAHPTDRYPYGLIGTAIGLGVSSVVSSYREVTEPQALLSNEGGAFGTLAGGLIHRLAAPDSSDLPALGMGIGGALGWLTAGLIGPFALPNVSSSRVLFAGLGGSVGALTGAAVASPAVVNSDRREPKKEGVLFASALGGLVLGSVVGYWFGDSDQPPSRHTSGSNNRTTASLIRRFSPGLGSTPASAASSPYGLRLPGSTNLTLSGAW
jgi:hypothetical protein